jgi:hypothetical protein
MVTAKITCNSKSEYGEGENRMATVGFMPDYQDGRNQEWAAATPHLELRMTLRGPVADRFEQGKSYTLTFTEED